MIWHIVPMVQKLSFLFVHVIQILSIDLTNYLPQSKSNAYRRLLLREFQNK